VIRSLTAVGFTYHQDILFLDRTDHGERWQSIAVTAARSAGVEVYDRDQIVDVVELAVPAGGCHPRLLPLFVISVERAGPSFQGQGDHPRGANPDQGLSRR
jgi:hypothetical protein